MKIEKYKKIKNGKYELTLEDGEKMELYEEVILKYNLLLTKKIEKKEEIKKYNNECEAYYIGLKYLNNRNRSKKEIYDYLIKKEYQQEIVEKQIQKLEKQGYINDTIYARSFLNNKILTTTHGPLKIKQELIKKGIKENILEEILKEYTSDIQIQKINKLITRMIKSNTNKGNSLLKRKIFSNLLSQGFEKSLIQSSIDNHKFKSDKETAEKEYKKLYQKLSKKYEGSELEFKIKQKLYQKGLIYEE